MEITKVKETFEFIREAWQRASALREEAITCRLSATGGAIRYDKDRVQTSPQDYQAKWIDRAADLDKEADKVLEMADGVRDMAYSWIKAACKPNEEFVLMQHYFLGKPYNVIKDEYICMFDYGSKTTMFEVAQRGMRRIAEKL